ncbi:class I SAM-dependent methyltransferase [Lentzea sp. CA-135723]|uniref:class I SAM-dependent methyltransferase n=1 Tax=Lentzea sp. CA-135723 TaxID=3239950 RepID=UPI003D8EB7A4
MSEKSAQELKGELWGRRAVQRAALGASMSMPAWKTAIERTGITHGTRVLDLACGSGEFCAAATEAGARAIGIDISPAMLAVARQASTAEFRELPLGPLPWQDNTFDVVTAFNALFFAEDPDEAFREARRVSKDYVVVCQWHPELLSDLLVVGRAVRGYSARTGAKLPEAQERITIDIPQVHADEATMLRSFLSVGSYQRVVEKEGEEKVAEKIKAAAMPYRTADGAYRFSNKYLMSVFRKGQAASIS